MFLTTLKMIEIEPSHQARQPSAATLGAGDNGPDCGPSPTLNSGELLGGKRAITIEHEGTQYVLRATRNGKLILTK